MKYAFLVSGVVFSAFSFMLPHIREVCASASIFYMLGAIFFHLVEKD